MQKINVKLGLKFEFMVWGIFMTVLVYGALIQFEWFGTTCTNSICICYKCLQFLPQITKDGKPKSQNPRGRKIPREEEPKCKSQNPSAGKVPQEEEPTASANVEDRETEYVRQCLSFLL